MKLNVDENQATAVKYEVLSIPTMILFKDGERGEEADRCAAKGAYRGRAGARAGVDSRLVPGMHVGMPESSHEHQSHTRRSSLAAVLLVLGLLFRQLATLVLAVLMTVIIAIPLSAGATRLERAGVPRPLGALATCWPALAVIAGILALIIPTFIDQVNEFVDDVPTIVARPRGDDRRHHGQPPQRGRRQHPGLPASATRTSPSG